MRGQFGGPLYYVRFTNIVDPDIFFYPGMRAHLLRPISMRARPSPAAFAIWYTTMPLPKDRPITAPEEKEHYRLALYFNHRRYIMCASGGKKKKKNGRHIACIRCLPPS